MKRDKEIINGDINEEFRCIVKKEPKLTSKEIQEYWTPERRASAKPLPLPTIKRKEIPEEELKTKEPVIHSGKKRTKDRFADVKPYGGH